MATELKSQETSKFWRDPALGSLEILHANYITFAYSRHAHDTFAIGTIMRGAETFEYRRKNYTAPAGTLVVVAPGEIHDGQAAMEGGWSYRMLYPDPVLLQQAVSQATGQARDIPFFPSPIIEDDFLVNLLVRLHMDLETPISPLERESRFLWLLSQLALRHADDRPRLHPDGNEHYAVKQVREYLEAHFAQNVTLQELAQVTGFSPFHLLRLFRRDMGLPPHAYQTQLRIAHARKLLVKGLPIAAIAQQTGFTDQSHLNHQFKRVTGVTPAQYKAQ